MMFLAVVDRQWRCTVIIESLKVESDIHTIKPSS